MKTILIKLKNIASKEDLLGLLSNKLNLSENNELNLDSLKDVLMDIHEETEIILRDKELFREAVGEEFAASFEKVLSDSAEKNGNLTVRLLPSVKGELHHACIAVKEFDKYVELFEELFNMTVNRVQGEAPKRKLWFNENVQINELEKDEVNGTSIDHIAIGVDDVRATVCDALEHGCTPLPNGAHWIALPNGTKVELIPNA